MANKETMQDVEKVLGDPVIIEMSQFLLAIRRNLLIASTVSISIVFAGLRLDPGSVIFGLKFVGLTDELVRLSLLLITIYLLLHFLWCSFDGFLEWKIRITGTRVSFITGATFISASGDYPKNPRQSTLYNWWVHEAKRIGDLNAPLEKIDGLLGGWQDLAKGEVINVRPATELHNLYSQVSDVRKELGNLKKQVEAAQNTITSNRIPVSLARFDKSFQLLLRSQNLRWILVEFAFPVAAGAIAVIMLLT